MASIIKTADCVREAVVVGVPRAGGFRPSQYRGDKKDSGDGGDQAAHESLETAMARAKRIVAEAAAAADRVRRDASALGYEEGFANGMAEARESAEEQLRCLAGIAANAVSDRESTIRAAEADLVKLALAIAERVIHREIACDPSIVASNVRAAIEKIASPDQVRILVSPEDLGFVKHEMERADGLSGLGVECQVVADDRVQRGGCIVETRAGMADARIETQMARLAEALETGRCP